MRNKPILCTVALIAIVFHVASSYDGGSLPPPPKSDYPTPPLKSTYPKKSLRPRVKKPPQVQVWDFDEIPRSTTPPKAPVDTPSLQLEFPPGYDGLQLEHADLLERILGMTPG